MTIHLPGGSTKTVLPQADEDLISYMDNPSPKTMKLRKKEIRKARRAKERAGRAPQGNVFARAPFAWWSGPKRIRRLLRRRA